MITNFEQVTEDLSKSELVALDTIVPLMVRIIPEGFMKSPELVRRMNEALLSGGIDFRMTEVKLRKYINHIRSNGLLPVIGTSKGYSISYKRADIEAQMKSLAERENSLKAAREGLEKLLPST